METFISALTTVMTIPVILNTLFGICLGMFIGSLPGLTATMGVAILLPFTFWLEPQAGLGMLLGIYNSAIFAGGISAVLLNMPGTPASIASTFDGYEITKRGEARLALWINTVFSVMGGLIGVLCFSVAAFPIARFALRFGPPEYAMIALFGISMMVSVSGKNILKGLLVGFIGLGISLVGLDPIWAVKRFTFGRVYLLDGISFIPIMIGMFGIGESLKQLSETKVLSKEDSRKTAENIKQELKEQKKSACKRLTLKEMWSMKIPFLLTNFISVIVGAIPGTGGDIAGIVSWTQCKNISRDKDRYGKGSEEALAMTCTANNACIGGAMTTMLTLGIPGDSVTAILIGALMMYNYVPGPLLFKDHADMVQVIVILLVLCNIFILFLGNLSSIIFAKFVSLPKSWISAAIICFSVTGSFALNNSAIDVLVCVISGIFGFFLYKADFPTGPMILALILGRMIESNLSRSLLLSKGSISIFFTRPVSLVLFILTVLALIMPGLIPHLRKYKERKATENCN
jgi:putative tricarboxylic transport membrane protein